MPITRKKPGDRQQLPHVKPEMNQGKLNHCHISDCMTLVCLSAAVTLFYCTSDMHCGLLLGLYKNYCLGSYENCHILQMMLLSSLEGAAILSLCVTIFLPLQLCGKQMSCVFVCVYICTSCHNWSWSHWQRRCKYLISDVATWVQYTPHEVICSYIWTLAHCSSNTSNPKNKMILILLYNIVLCSVCVLGVLCTLCIAYCANCFQLIARTWMCCYKQYLLSQPQKSESKVTLQLTRFILMLTWLPVTQEKDWQCVLYP